MPDLPKHRIDDSDREEDTVAKDQASHGYYYDDAYGYEDYRPDDDDMEEIDEDSEREQTSPSGSAGASRS